ncbi:MAG: hypothetical protein AAF840_02850 [Bacteroidota bacterium]
MYAFLNKYGQALAFGIGVLVTAIFVISIFSIPEAEMETIMSENAGPEKYATTGFDFGLYASIGLTILALVGAAIFGIIQLASNPKGSLKGILGFAALVVIALIAYSMANDVVANESPEIVKSIDKFNTDQGADFDGGTLKFVSGSIITALVLVALSVLSLVVFGIRSIFK